MKKGLLFAFSFLLIACGGTQNPAQTSIGGAQSEAEVSAKVTTPDARGYLVEEGQVAPQFRMHLTTGDSLLLSDLKGKLVMLQFTASWCSVCRKEMPHIESEVWAKYKDNPRFALFGIDREEPLETVVKFAQQVGVTYPMVLDLDANIFGKYADLRAGITRNVIIDETGKIIMLTRLFNEEEFNAMVQLIDEKMQILSQK